MLLSGGVLNLIYIFASYKNSLIAPAAHCAALSCSLHSMAHGCWRNTLTPPNHLHYETNVMLRPGTVGHDPQRHGANRIARTLRHARDGVAARSKVARTEQQLLDFRRGSSGREQHDTQRTRYAELGLLREAMGVLCQNAQYRYWRRQR